MQKLSLSLLAFAVISLFVVGLVCGEAANEILADVSELTKNESTETKNNSFPGKSDYFVEKAKWTFKLYKYRKTWNDARKFCVAKGGQLVVLDSAEKQATLRSRLVKAKLNWLKLKALWIGFHDLFEEGSWTTVTDELVDAFDYNPWAKDEPNNFNNLQHCAIIWRTNITDGVDDYRCDGKFAFACEKTSC
ncbi:salivary C-type lectin 2-like [Augochlora pura]